MLENLVTWILNNYIGEYFCLNTDQLSVAFLQGQVDLENVPLRSSSLRKFDIPLQLKHGLIGKLQLQVPLTRIRSQPWILRIRDFLVILGPYSSNYDVEIVEQYKQQNLEKMLDELEIGQKKQLLAQLGIRFNENTEQTSWWGTTSLLSTICSNIQILLENVHIKYECSDFNFGVKINSLHVQTTNAQWRVGFVEPTDGVNIFKKIVVKGFSIYWNPENTCNDSPIVLPLTLESLKSFFSSSSENVNILQPLTLELRMEKNSSHFPLRSKLLPRFKFNVRSQKIELELTQKQVSQIQQFLDDWTMFERARPHRKWRPLSSIITSPRRWWQFAINRQLEQIRCRNICKKPKELFARLHMLNTYCRAYRHRLNCFLSSYKNNLQNVSPLNDKHNATKYSLEETTLLKQIEHGADFSYSDLHILREAVFQKMLTELKQQTFSSDNNVVERTESPFQIIESEPEILQTDISKIQETQAGVGWLNWVSNWFVVDDENLKNNNEIEENNDLFLNDSIYLNNFSIPKLTNSHPLSPELEEIEKRMQSEILQMLNDSLDDYNILRRDNLLAELIFNFTRVHLRVATDKITLQEECKNDETKQINLLMLTFNLDQLCGRINISPKEHRTEMSINVGDLSIQLMKQQQVIATKFLIKEERINEHNEKLYNTDHLKNNNGNEESLFCGFQKNISDSDITTNLLFTIGKRSENSVTNITTKDTSPILELFYKRLSPKLEIYHELNISCAPLAMIVDDYFRSALQDIVGCMEQKPLNHTTTPSDSNNLCTNSSTDSSLLHQIFISLTVPELLIELRNQKASHDLILLTLLSFNFIKKDLEQNWRLNSEQFCIWLLKETTLSDCGMAPFLRFNILGLNAQGTLRRAEMHFTINVDNYRERSPVGWEPLLERLRIARLELEEHPPHKWNLWIRPSFDSLAKFNITQTFIEDLLDFIFLNNEFFNKITNTKIFNLFDKLIEEIRDENIKTSTTTNLKHNNFSFSESYRIQQQKHLNKSNSENFASRPSTSSAYYTRSNVFDSYRAHSPSDIDLDIKLDLPDGIGISLIGNICEDNNNELLQEELIYALFYSVSIRIQRRQNNTYLCSCSSQSLQFDNQIFGADRHNLFFCHPNALRDEPIIGPYPALNFEMSYTSTDILDSYESFRLKLCNSCILLDERLLWRLINFYKNIMNYHNRNKLKQQATNQQVTRNCFFGAFQLEFGDISLSVLTIDKNVLPPSLRILKEFYAETVSLVNFENALVKLEPFWAHRCLTTCSNLFANVVDFYIGQLKRQKLNIFVAMDAIGNPIGLANEFKEGFEGLLFEGDVAGFTFGIGYGAANSISKVASSMAQGVGSLTFDEQHEQLRRWMLNSKPEQETNALAYLYGGLKGFGIGVFGGLTAIARNTFVATKQEGVLPGVIRGVTTGAVDTFTKPLQGTLDLVEGTASALREVVGAPLVRRAHFPKRRLRLPRVCSSLNGLLPTYSKELSEAQQDLLRITGTYTLNDDNRLLCIIPFYEFVTREGWVIYHRALIVPSQCYICRNTIEGNEDNFNFIQEKTTSITHRILFEQLKNVQIISPSNKHKRSASSSNLKNTISKPIKIEIFYNNNLFNQKTASFNYNNFKLNNKQRFPALTLLSTNIQSAQYFSKQLMKAKVIYDSRLQLKHVNNTNKNEGKKKNLIFII